MRRRVLTIGIALSVALNGAGGATAIAFSEQEALDHVRKLANDIGVRVRGHGEERRAAKYVRHVFRRLGYETKVQTFGVDGRRSRNVLAWWPGAVDYPFVIGGHIDTVPRSPGANDNASGVAVVLENARLFAGTPQVELVEFVAFGSEEFGPNGKHHVGSQTYVRRLSKKERRRLPGMASVDMVADGRPLIVATAGIGPRLVANRMHDEIRDAGIRAVRKTLCDCSDHGPFERAGIPAAFLWSGPEPDHHQPSDTIPNLKRRDLVRSGRALRAFLEAVDQDMIDRFQKA